MTTLSVSMTELWPVFELVEIGHGWNEKLYPPAEFTDAEIASIEQANDEFRRWQDIVSERFGITE